MVFIWQLLIVLGCMESDKNCSGVARTSVMMMGVILTLGEHDEG